jgi:hypothetical protein
MRRETPTRNALGSPTKALAIALSLLTGLGPVASLRAVDDERYSYTPPRFQDYQNQYKPQNNFSPSYLLDRQISNQNAAIQMRFGQRQDFKTPTFSFSSINTPTFSAPKFQFSSPDFKPLAALKAELPKPQTLGQKEPRGVWGILNAGVKGVVNAFVNAFQKIGHAVGRVAQAFTIDKAKITYEARRDRILKENPNIQEVGKGVFQVPQGKQFQQGGYSWEAGSTFKMTNDGRGVRLEEGVTMSPDMGGIKRMDGGLVPVKMSLENDRYAPTGIDFSRVEPKTVFGFTHPVSLDGVGTVSAGAVMTYEGARAGTRADPASGFVLTFKNAKIENPGKALEAITGRGPVTLTQMEVRLRGAINQINGLHVQRGTEKVYVSRYGEAFSVSQLEEKAARVGETSTALEGQMRKLANDVNGATNHSQKLIESLHGHTGTAGGPAFQVRPALREQSDLAAALHEKANAITEQMAAGSYEEAANTITALAQAQGAMKSEIEKQKTQGEAFQGYKRALKGLEKAYGQMATQADHESLRTAQVTDEQIKSAGRYFGEQKNEIRIRTTDALNALDSLEALGLISTAENAIKAAEIIGISRHLLAARPDKFGNAVGELTTAMKDHYESVSRDFDVAIFDRLDALAERYPRTMQFVGQGALAVAGGAAIVGVGYGLATAPATTVVVAETGIISQKTFEAMGLPPEMAAYFTAIVMAPVAVGVGKSQSLRGADRQIVQGVRGFGATLASWFKSEGPAVGGLASQRGYILTPRWSAGAEAVGANLGRSAAPSGRIDYSVGFEGDLATFRPGAELFQGPVRDDLVLVQYHRDVPLGQGRSAKFWTPVETANKYATLGEVMENSALLPEWGPRDIVSVARVPRGTEVTYYVGEAARQVSQTGQVYDGKGMQMRFKDFDPGWIVETRKIPN